MLKRGDNCCLRNISSSSTLSTLIMPVVMANILSDLTRIKLLKSRLILLHNTPCFFTTRDPPVHHVFYHEMSQQQ